MNSVLTISMKQSHSSEIKSNSFKNFPTFYGTRRSITVFTRNSHCTISLSQMNPVLTQWSRVLLEKPIVTHLVNNFPAFYGTRRFNTVSSRAHHWALTCAT
jgi:hypothetical protein